MEASLVLVVRMGILATKRASRDSLALFRCIFYVSAVFQNVLHNGYIFLNKASYVTQNSVEEAHHKSYRIRY